jgi:hypothetical protein
VHGAGELPTLANLVAQLGDYPTAVPRLTAANLLTLGQHYLAALPPLAHGQRYVIDKTPLNFLHIGLLRLILPNARIIHCRRDPMDTCLSCYTKLFETEQKFTYDQRELGLFYTAYRRLMAHWIALVPEDRLITVDYETLVGDLTGEAGRVLEFLDLPWNDACLNFHDTKRVVRTASLSQVRQPLYQSAVGRWKAHATNLQPLIEILAAETR